jgi:hypothetical protein
LRRRDAEIGQRPLQRQPCCGLGLPQEIAEVAFFAALALAGRRPVRSGYGADFFRFWEDFFVTAGFRRLGVFREATDFAEAAILRII